MDSIKLSESLDSGSIPDVPTSMHILDMIFSTRNPVKPKDALSKLLYKEWRDYHWDTGMIEHIIRAKR